MGGQMIGQHVVAEIVRAPEMPGYGREIPHRQRGPALVHFVFVRRHQSSLLPHRQKPGGPARILARNELLVANLSLKHVDDPHVFSAAPMAARSDDPEGEKFAKQTDAVLEARSEASLTDTCARPEPLQNARTPAAKRSTRTPGRHSRDRQRNPRHRRTGQDELVAAGDPRPRADRPGRSDRRPELAGLPVSWRVSRQLSDAEQEALGDDRTTNAKSARPSRISPP
ncbi:hypothetical protein F9C11_32205 [Amycolatopsis sp. VS8301801F10]|uniref:hypothetical protein n=1 Tax=Amycolatopsis sp. VS8301801F10 TaxID=2652442 RepID=UPI0038FD3025